MEYLSTEEISLITEKLYKKKLGIYSLVRKKYCTISKPNGALIFRILAETER